MNGSPASRIMVTSPALRGTALRFLTFCAVGSRASHTRPPVSDWPAQTPATSGENVSEPFASFDPVTRSLRTSQGCLLLMPDDSSTESCRTWPRSGTMRSGRCYRRPTLERPTAENESGLWPTPTAAEGTKIPARANYGQVGLNNHPRIRGEPDRPRLGKDRLGVDGGKSTRQTWQTPTANEGADCGSLWGALRRLDRGGRLQRQMATLETVETVETERAALNPVWVEWLMGYPPDWTALERSATPSSRNARSKARSNASKPSKPNG